MGGTIDPNYGLPFGMTPERMEIAKLRAEIDRLTKQLAETETANRVLTLAANELETVRRERNQLREQLAAALRALENLTPCRSNIIDTMPPSRVVAVYIVDGGLIGTFSIDQLRRAQDAIDAARAL